MPSGSWSFRSSYRGGFVPAGLSSGKAPAGRARRESARASRRRKGGRVMTGSLRASGGGRPGHDNRTGRRLQAPARAARPAPLAQPPRQGGRALPALPVAAAGGPAGGLFFMTGSRVGARSLLG